MPRSGATALRPRKVAVGPWPHLRYAQLTHACTHARPRTNIPAAGITRHRELDQIETDGEAESETDYSQIPLVQSH